MPVITGPNLWQSPLPVAPSGGPSHLTCPSRHSVEQKPVPIPSPSFRVAFQSALWGDGFSSSSLTQGLVGLGFSQEVAPWE